MINNTPLDIDIVDIYGGGAFPSQWYAWDAEGDYYYIRYRHGFLTVVKGDVLPLPGGNGESIFSLQVTEDDDGIMGYNEMRELTGLRFTDETVAAGRRRNREVVRRRLDTLENNRTDEQLPESGVNDLVRQAFRQVMEKVRRA